MLKGKIRDETSVSWWDLWIPLIDSSNTVG
jgi:hypothetical protein